MDKLRRIDLNLLVTLHALLQEKHISRAAIRLHKSQPAVSHALAHLRRIFDDPLLVRRLKGLELTDRASGLLPALIEALGQLSALLDPPVFEPGESKRTFRLAMSDYGAKVALPYLIKTLRSHAPGVQLVVTQGSREAMIADVMAGELDMALGVFNAKNHDGELKARTLFEERFVCVADRSTLPARGRLDMNSWLTRPHVLVAMRAGNDNEIDLMLHRSGKQRNVAVVLPHWGVAADIIAGTDLVLTVARRCVNKAKLDRRLKMFPSPVDIPPFEFNLIWHQRRDGDLAHAWLREVLIQGVGEAG